MKMFENKKGFGNINVFPSSTGVFGSLPFYVKLPISLLVDFVGLGFAVGAIATFITGLWPVLAGVVSLAIIYAVIQAILAAFLWNVYVLTIPIFIIESAPVLNAIPSMTIICLWNGYKTGWKH